MATWKHLSLFAIALFLSFCCAAARAENDPKAEYLSALLSDRMVSMTQGWGELGVDTAVKPIGDPAAKLRIKDKEYAHGLGHHANGEIVFDLAGNSRRFRPKSACNGRTETIPGSVVFQIFVDGKKVFDSGVMRENDPPRPVTVSVEGADELRLVVNDAGDGITADCADWADARLTRDPAAKVALSRRSMSPPSPACSLGIRKSWKERRPAASTKSRPRTSPRTRRFFRPRTDLCRSDERRHRQHRPAMGRESHVAARGDRVSRAAAVPPAESIQLQYWTGEAQLVSFNAGAENPPGKAIGSRRRPCRRRSATAWSGGSAIERCRTARRKSAGSSPT